MAAAVAACSTIARAKSHQPTTTTTHRSVSSTKKRPNSFEVGITTFHWTDSSRTTYNAADPVDPISGRVLTTQVRYPTLDGSSDRVVTGAKPATGDGPFPVIVFAHGFDVSPPYYAPLLDSWARAGFVVVSPFFPDENTTTVNKDGGPYSSEGTEDESDVTSEPGDIPFVLKQFDAVAAKGSGKLLAGIAQTSDVALAGQSDGAEVVAGLEFDSAFSSVRAEMPVVPKAVAVLSGQALIAGDATNTYSAGASSPAVLQVQSDTDTCNGAQDAADLFSLLTGSPVHLFETLQGASHLEPYTDLVAGNDPWAGAVEKVTTAFFDLELGWHSKGVSVASIESAGAVDGVSKVSSTVGAFPNAPPGDDCSGLPIVSAAGASGTGSSGNN